MTSPLILQCSPRPGGNSAHAAKLVQAMLRQGETPHRLAGGQVVEQGGKQGQPKGQIGGHIKALTSQGNSQLNGQSPSHVQAHSQIHDQNHKDQPQKSQQKKDQTQDYVPILNLYDYSIAPCIGCDICAIPKSHTTFFLGCPLAPKDDSEPLFRALFQASTLYLISPIYHYHLPAQAKAVLDRLQPFYWMEQGKAPYPPDHHIAKQGPQRRYYPIFIAGQERGQKLFDGSRLTLRYSFHSAGFTNDDWLGLRGLDPKNALKNSPQAQGLLREFITRTLTNVTNQPPVDNQTNTANQANGTSQNNRSTSPSPQASTPQSPTPHDKA